MTGLLNRLARWWLSRQVAPSDNEAWRVRQGHIRSDWKTNG